MPIEFREWVEKARAVKIGAILEARQITLPGKGKRLAGPCPLCAGTDRFAVDVERQVFNCRGCGGHGQGSISFVQFLDGTDFLQAVETLTGEPPPKKGERRKPNVETASQPQRGRFECSYSYVDEGGAELFQVVRFTDPKGFMQRRADPDREGQWINNLKDVRLVPYHLPEVLEAVSHETPVVWVEGEKDADAATGLGLVATTTAMGVAGKGHWEKGLYDDYFRGGDIVLVPDRDDDVHKGFALAAAIHARLKPIATRVRLVELPAGKDFSEWLAAGGTREAFDALVERAPDFGGEAKSGNGNGHAAGPYEEEFDFGGNGADPADDEGSKIEPVPVRDTLGLKGETMPRRAWITPGLLLRKNVTILVAPPGSGKSLLTLQQGLMLGCGKPWGGWRPRGSFKVLVINAEDDADEMERRIYAAKVTMEIDERAENYKSVIIAENPNDIVIAKVDRRTKTVVRQPMLERIIETVRHHKVDVLIVDPFAETFEGDENSNSELKWCAVLWREVARQTGAAVMLVHHTRKYAHDSAGDMDAARGGGALVGVARIVSTLFTMTDEEAELYSIEGERHEYLRFDDAKANLTMVTFKAKWFQKKSFTLPNGTEAEPADEVGVLVPWMPASIWARLTDEEIKAILDYLDRGVRTEEGRPTGDPFALSKKGGSNRWAGQVIMDHVEKCTEKEAVEILNAWVKSGLIKEFDAPTSTSKGKSRKGIRIDNTKRPGTKTDEVSL